MNFAGFRGFVRYRAAALTNAMGGGRTFVSAMCVRRLQRIAAHDGSPTRRFSYTSGLGNPGGALNVMEYLRASTLFLSWNQFSVLKNSFQSMSTGSLLRAHPASRSISALTTKLLKEGTTIETLGGVMDPENEASLRIELLSPTEETKPNMLNRQPEGRVVFEAPMKLLCDMLHKKGFLDSKTQPAPIDPILTQEDHRIVAWYRSIGTGILNYYLFCENLTKVRSIVNYHLRWSAIYTLAKKHKSSSAQVIRNYTKNLIITKNGEKLASFLDPEEISQYKRQFLKTDHTPPEILIDLLFAKLVRNAVLGEPCAVKGCTDPEVEMHHIHQIEKAGGKHKVRSVREAQILEGIKAVQSALKKKHIPLCAKHHDDLHMGRVFLSDLDMNLII